LKEVKHTEAEMSDFEIYMGEVYGEVVPIKKYKYYGPQLSEKYQNATIKPFLDESELDEVLKLWHTMGGGKATDEQK
jgi:hypothetical protein